MGTESGGSYGEEMAELPKESFLAGAAFFVWKYLLFKMKQIRGGNDKRTPHNNIGIPIKQIHRKMGRKVTGLWVRDGWTAKG